MESYAEMIYLTTHPEMSEEDRLKLYNKTIDIAIDFENKYKGVAWMGMWNKTVEDFLNPKEKTKLKRVSVNLQSKLISISETRTFEDTPSGNADMDSYLNAISGVYGIASGEKESFDMGRGFFHKKEDDSAYLSVKINSI